MDESTDKIKALEKEIEQLSALLESKQEELRRERTKYEQKGSTNGHSLTNSEISRFSRQIILKEVGVQGQIKLKDSKVLIVGAGGLGKLKNIHLK